MIDKVLNWLFNLNSKFQYPIDVIHQNGTYWVYEKDVLVAKYYPSANRLWLQGDVTRVEGFHKLILHLLNLKPTDNYKLHCSFTVQGEELDKFGRTKRYGF